MRFLRFMLATLAVLALTVYPIWASSHAHEATPVISSASHVHGSHHAGHHQRATHVAHAFHELPCSSHHDHKRCCGVACCGTACAPLVLTDASLVGRVYHAEATFRAPDDRDPDGVPPVLPQRPPRTI